MKKVNKKTMMMMGAILGVFVTGGTSSASADTKEEVRPVVVSPINQKEAVTQNVLQAGVDILAMKQAEAEPEEHIKIREGQRIERENMAKKEAQEKEDALKEKMKKDWEDSFPVISGGSATASFINTISRDAVEIARKHDIYPSVLLAQSAHESANGKSGLGAAPYYNLFGIKGAYKGQSASFQTGEEYGGQSVTITASFRSYPSWKESMDDYASLLTGGLTGNPNFYSGTWRSVSSNYEESTNSLMGKYATDSNYAPKLNSIIRDFGLDRFDNIKELDLSKVKVLPVVKEVEIPTDIHVVKDGDSLMGISLLYETSVAEIMELNEISNPVLHINQWIKIPQKETVITKDDSDKINQTLETIQKSKKVYFTMKKDSTKTSLN